MDLTEVVMVPFYMILLIMKNIRDSRRPLFHAVHSSYIPNPAMADNTKKGLTLWQLAVGDDYSDSDSSSGKCGLDDTYVLRRGLLCCWIC